MSNSNFVASDVELWYRKKLTALLSGTVDELRVVRASLFRIHHDATEREIAKEALVAMERCSLEIERLEETLPKI